MRLRSPELRLHWTGPVTQVVVFSGDEGWVCVEPVTMANDGFRMADEGMPGTGVLALDPGESFAVTIHLRVVAAVQSHR